MTNESKLKRGARSKYTKELIEKSWEYLEIWDTLGDMIPSNEALQDFIGISNATLYNWRLDDEKKEFRVILEKIKRKQFRTLINKGLNNEFNSNIVKLALGKHGFHDRNEISGPDGGDIKTDNKWVVEFISSADK